MFVATFLCCHSFIAPAWVCTLPAVHIFMNTLATMQLGSIATCAMSCTALCKLANEVYSYNTVSPPISLTANKWLIARPVYTSTRSFTFWQFKHLPSIHNAESIQWCMFDCVILIYRWILCWMVPNGCLPNNQRWRVCRLSVSHPKSEYFSKCYHKWNYRAQHAAHCIHLPCHSVCDYSARHAAHCIHLPCHSVCDSDSFLSTLEFSVSYCYVYSTCDSNSFLSTLEFSVSYCYVYSTCDSNSFLSTLEFSVSYCYVYSTYTFSATVSITYCFCEQWSMPGGFLLGFGYVCTYGSLFLASLCRGPAPPPLYIYYDITCIVSYSTVYK